MSNAAIIRAAMTGQGKTFWVKKEVIPNTKNVLVFDIYDEYTDLPIIPIGEYKEGKYRCVPESEDDIQEDFERFVSECKYIVNTTVVMEDCTNFLGYHSHKMLKTLLVKKRHQNIVYVLLFHSLAYIPNFVYDLSTHIILSRTNDLPDDVKKTFKSVKLAQLVWKIKQTKEDFPIETFTIL